MSIRQLPSRNRNKKWLLAVLAVSLIVLLAVAAMAATHSLWFKPKYVAHKTASQATKGEPSTKASNNTTSNTGTNNSPPNTQNSSSNSSVSSAPLLTPTGDFVSNHHPNLSGSPAPNTIASACDTTPGAICRISFTMNGVTKSLSPQVVDSGGATYWNWKLQDVGLTSGSWSVQAIATLNGQTKTANDAMALQVAP